MAVNSRVWRSLAGLKLLLGALACLLLSLLLLLLLFIDLETKLGLSGV
jgi:hypothetical protein